MVSVVVGTAVAAAAGGWLLAAGGTPPAPPAAGPSPVPPQLRLGRDPGDLRVTGGGIEVPILDSVEMLPRCHP
jgi:hypothetical protein